MLGSLSLLVDDFNRCPVLGYPVQQLPFAGFSPVRPVRAAATYRVPCRNPLT
jgi:hypothetical protein